MTADGGMSPETYWEREEARRALGRVAQLFNRDDEFRLEELRGLENYELIPASVREALEGLTPEERQAVKKLFTSLAENHFYLENGLGGLAFY
jgi:hypothetical protein